MLQCLYCHRHAVHTPKWRELPICENCAAANLCYFCRTSKATLTVPMPRNWQSKTWSSLPSDWGKDLSVPNCEACWAQQLKIASVSHLTLTAFFTAVAAAVCIVFGVTAQLLALVVIAYV